mmetsp:Transcript_8401/g.25386  ORF Transcript_8401/g.25386 Transcript_8401/m.25386 type:complete len:282 (-) Transcript_8401:1089-1934(-)
MRQLGHAGVPAQRASASHAAPSARPFIVQHAHVSVKLSRGVTAQPRHMPARTHSSMGSLIPQTLEDMEVDGELQAHLAQLAKQGQAKMTREEQRQRERALNKLNVPSFGATCKAAGVNPLTRGPATTLQLNIGLYCNQACTHCHVESSPKRTEMMDRKTVDACVGLMKSSSDITTVDITGGAPELNSEFRYLVQQARALGLTVLDRCNLTGGSACCAAAVRWDASGELCPLSALVRRATCALPATKNAPYLRASHAYLFVPMNARSRQAVHSAHHVGISSA